MHFTFFYIILSLMEAFNNPHLTFFSLLVLAFVIKRLPVLRYPVRWLDTFFHELSHGLAAIFTGGKAHRLRVMFGGAGLCTTYGGSRFIILLSGYLGAVVFGCLIYLSALASNDSDAIYVLVGLLGILTISTLFLVRDFVTLLIVLFISAFLYLPFSFPNLPQLALLVKLLGLSVLLSACLAPLHLIDGKLEGDGAELFRMTLLPEGFWIALWLAFGMGGIFFLWQASLPDDMRIWWPFGAFM